MKQSKGITLIALVVTIVILLILAGISISTLGGENGLIAKATIAKRTSIKAEMREQLVLALTELQLEKRGEATLDDVTQEWADNTLEKYEPLLSNDASTSGKKITMYKSGVVGKYLIGENLNIVETEENESSIEFLYEALEIEEGKVNILISVRDRENGLKKVELPDGCEIEMYGTKAEKAIDYIVELGKEYKIKIISESGEELEKIILIEDYWYKITKNLSKGINIDNLAIKVAHNKSYTVTLTTDEQYLLDILTVTMGGEDITISGNNIVDISTGKIYIEKVTGDIEIYATVTSPHIIQQWLKAGDLYSKYNYRKIEDILNDNNCLTDLMNNYNAVDYMISQTEVIMLPICSSKSGITALAKSKYARYKAIENEEWYESILNSGYEECFANEMDVPQTVNSIEQISDNLYSTGIDGMELYSEGRDGDISYQGKTTEYLPLAFDNNETTCWLSRNTGVQYFPGRLGVSFNKNVILYKVIITIKEGTKFDEGVYVQVLDNSDNWINISDNYIIEEGTYTLTCMENTIGNRLAIYIPSIDNNNNRAKIYEIKFLYTEVPELINVNQNIKEWLEKINVNVSLDELIDITNYYDSLINSKEAVNYMIDNEELFDYIINNKVFMSKILKSSYAKYKIVTNENAYQKIENSEYLDKFDESNIYTSNITSLSASSTTGIYDTDTDIKFYSYSSKGVPSYDGSVKPYLKNLFDGDTSTAWISRTTASSYYPARIGAIFPKSLICYKVEVMTKNTSKLSDGFCIQGSNDLNSWVELTDYIKTDGVTKVKTNNLLEYNSFVLYIPSIKSNSTMFKVYELKFYFVEKGEE